MTSTNFNGISQQPIPAAPNPQVCAQPLFESKVPAGFPSPATDYLEDTLDLNHYLVHNKAATYFFNVSGDSMSGAGIFDGDKVIVDRSFDPQHKNIVIAIYNGEYTIKTLCNQNGVIELRPENPAYKTITLTEGNELIVWGVVTGIIRKLKL